MTELEKIAYAKSFIDKLAQGINPLDDSPIPENDLANNVRLSRCFFYVSDILRQVIENGGTDKNQRSAASKKGQTPFAVTAEQLAGFEFSAEAIPVSKITQRLNALVDLTVYKNLRTTAVTGWLCKIGVLETIETPSGQNIKRPTAAGEQLGIYTEQRLGQNGPYTAVVYTLEAQHFIIDNMDAIIAYAEELQQRKLEEKANQGQPWSELMDESMLNMYRQNKPISEIAAMMKRTPSAVRRHLNHLGVYNL